jgi:uncharacterized protein (TIRG00374 family)
MMKYIKLIIIVSIIASLAIFLNATDFRKVLESVKQIGWKFIILILVTFLSAILGTLSWRSCLGKQADEVSIGQLFLIRHIGEVASIFNPAGVVGGEALKVHLLCSSQKLDKKTVLASILVSRAIMILTQLLLSSFVALWLFIPDLNLLAVTHYAVYLILAGTSLALIMLLFYLRTNIKALFLRMRLGSVLKNKTVSFRAKLHELLVGMSSLYQSNKKAVVYATLYALLHWIIGATEFYLILTFLGIDVHMLQAILVDMGVIFFKTAGFFVPAQAGIEEYGNKIMLAVIGVTGTEIWITVSILRRARQLFWLAFGIAVYLFMYKTWTQRLQDANGNIVR